MSEQLYSSPRTIADPASCSFYHVMDIPGHGLVGDQWDLRGNEDAYLGQIDLKGKRVLEIGPASGYITFYMESQGADVVAVELDPNRDWDIVPDAHVDLDSYRALRREGIDAVRNAFWFAHERFKSSARVHYGNVYDLPAELGHFDTAVLCSVLLHLRDPLKVVENCARLADQLVIVDMHYPHLPNDRALAEWFSEPDEPMPDIWWRFTPQLFVRFGEVMGFQSNTVTYHEQRYVQGGDIRPGALFTVVSSRRSTQ